MITLETARNLREAMEGAGVPWSPSAGDRFLVPDRGFDDPFIVVTTGLLNLMNEEEQRFVIGHETSHILSGHAVYRTMLDILTRLAARVAWIPLGYIGDCEQDIGRAVVALLSPDMRYLTGAVIPLDGGQAHFG